MLSSNFFILPAKLQQKANPAKSTTIERHNILGIPTKYNKNILGIPTNSGKNILGISTFIIILHSVTIIYTI
jgi:hypothetical protein